MDLQESESTVSPSMYLRTRLFTESEMLFLILFTRNCMVPSSYDTLSEAAACEAVVVEEGEGDGVGDKGFAGSSDFFKAEA